MKRQQLAVALGVAVLPLIILCMPACQGQKTAPQEHTNPQQTITVKLGQPFAITLESNRTTGYQWELAQPLDGAILKLANSEYKAPNTTRVGAGGEEVWTFQTVGKGKAEILMKYVRPWEKDVAPAKTQTFKVVVR
jgi:inhibitor of cysteine peptidase